VRGGGWGKRERAERGGLRTRNNNNKEAHGAHHTQPDAVGCGGVVRAPRVDGGGRARSWWLDRHPARSRQNPHQSCDAAKASSKEQEDGDGCRGAHTHERTHAHTHKVTSAHRWWVTRAVLAQRGGGGCLECCSCGREGEEPDGHVPAHRRRTPHPQRTHAPTAVRVCVLLVHSGKATLGWVRGRAERAAAYRTVAHHPPPPRFCNLQAHAPPRLHPRQEAAVTLARPVPTKSPRMKVAPQ
jgi:hypothetical protein